MSRKIRQTPVEPSTSGITKAEEKPEDPEVPKKKKKKKEKKSALEKFQEDLRKQKAREMALARHRGIQCARDFPTVIAYRQTLDPGSLDTINGADHTGFLIQEANTGRVVLEPEERQGTQYP